MKAFSRTVRTLRSAQLPQRVVRGAAAVALGVSALAVTASPAHAADSWSAYFGLSSGAVDYNAVAQSIADMLESNPDYGAQTALCARRGAAARGGEESPAPL